MFHFFLLLFDYVVCLLLICCCAAAYSSPPPFQFRAVCGAVLACGRRSGADASGRVALVQYASQRCRYAAERASADERAATFAMPSML